MKTQRGGNIQMPYVAPPVSFTLRESLRGSVDELRKRLLALQAKDSGLQIAEITPAYQLSPYATLTASPGACSSVPFPAGAHCGIASLKKYPTILPTTVAVLDSGIPKDDPRFHFWTNSDATKDDLYGNVKSVGVNMIAGGGFPKEDVTVKYALNHGTHVAGIATCRLAAGDFLKDIDARLQLMVLKVAKTDASVNPDAIHEAIMYARFHGADVINMSFEGPKSLTVATIVTENPKILFVAAAGNGVDQGPGRNLDEKSIVVYPAQFSTTFPNVISVAAHDANFNIACFSNYGGTTVDLAAPGAGVESTIQKVDPGPNGVSTTALSGTSQAAPFVTFAAALLHARGLQDAAAIKLRLIDSAEFKPNLVGKVRAEGTLNIARALAYDADIVQLADGSQPIFGTLSKLSLSLPGIAAPVPLDQVRKIIRGYSATPGRSTKVILKGAGLPPFVVGDITLPDFTITANGVARTVSASQVREIIPKL